MLLCLKINSINKSIFLFFCISSVASSKIDKLYINPYNTSAIVLLPEPFLPTIALIVILFLELYIVLTDSTCFILLSLNS